MNDFIQDIKTLASPPVAVAEQRKAFGKVAVILGGTSAERAISLQSGQNILNALIRQGVLAHALDAQSHLVEKLIEGKFDRAFIALHGTQGEDGIIQGLLQSLNIPFTGSGVAASALAMDKARAKLVMNGLKIPTPLFGLASSLEKALQLAKKMRFPLAIKPVAEGSSIGVTRVTHLAELPAAFIKAAAYGKVMVEQWIEGKDFFVSVLEEAVLPSVEVHPAGDFYDYQAKYESLATQYLCPSSLNAIQEKSIRKIAYQAFKALGCEGWGRIDLVQDKSGQFWVLEVNTIPGMTSHSLMPLSAQAVGISFDELVIKILATTLAPSLKSGALSPALAVQLG